METDGFYWWDIESYSNAQNTTKYNFLCVLMEKVI